MKVFHDDEDGDFLDGLVPLSKAEVVWLVLSWLVVIAGLVWLGVLFLGWLLG